MAAIHVNLAAVPRSHKAPALLLEVGAFIKTLSHGALGWFDGMTAEAIPDGLGSDVLRAHGFAFLQLPDGSCLVVLDRVEGAPVVLLDADGPIRVVGDTFAAFLRRWSQAATDVSDLDDEDAYARLDLATWLDSKQVPTSLKGNRFDLATLVNG